MSEAGRDIADEPYILVLREDAEAWAAEHGMGIVEWSATESEVPDAEPYHVAIEVNVRLALSWPGDNLPWLIEWPLRDGWPATDLFVLRHRLRDILDMHRMRMMRHEGAAP